MAQIFFLLVLLVPSASQQSPPELERRITEYWNYLIQQDKASALQFVSPDARNDFIRRREPMMRSWNLKSVELLSPTSAKVVVEVERLTTGGEPLGFTPITENWIWQEGQWLAAIAMPSQKEVLEAVTRNPASGASEIALTGKVRSIPPQLKIWFLSPRSEGSIRIQNEKSEAIEIAGVEFDQASFKLLESPARIEPRSRAILRLEYTGDEIKKNLESHLVIRYRIDGVPESLPVDIIYNYFSAASRGLFGLTKEEADKLPRGVVPRPKIKLPESQKPPNSSPPKPSRQDS